MDQEDRWPLLWTDLAHQKLFVPHKHGLTIDTPRMLLRWPKPRLQTWTEQPPSHNFADQPAKGLTPEAQ